MGFFSRFFSGGSPEFNESQLVILDGSDDLDVVGESYQQENLWALVGGASSEKIRVEVIGYLVPEPENKYDPNAIGVWIQGRKVGFVAKELAREIVDDLLRLMSENGDSLIGLRGVIAGGGQYADGPGQLGAFLEYPAHLFGQNNALPDPHNVGAGLMNSGHSSAMMTDDIDDSYDLSWSATLSQDPSKRILDLRKILEVNTEPLSRHFAYIWLEDILYDYKEVFPDALVQYDEVCEKHAKELETSIRIAMISKWGKLANLQVHRQSSIRHAKAKDLQKALYWAELGLKTYGNDAFKEEWTLDLKKRVATLTARIEKKNAK
jgi:hypothetical protein